MAGNKVAITGGRGMLGSDLKSLLESEGFEPVIYDLPDFDLTNERNLCEMVDSCDMIVNCAAYTAVDKAESEPEVAEAVNAGAVAKLAELAKNADKYLLHISTDFVFGDSSDAPLNEESRTNPLSVYGATKLKGEEMLRESGCKHSIIRVEWTYGIHGNNFIKKIIELAGCLDAMKVVADQIGAPTPTEFVAKAILCFLKNKTEGLYHFAADGYASRYDVAEFIVNKKGMEVKLQPCSSSEFQAPAMRPLNSRFDCSRIDKVLDFKRPAWKDALSDYLDKN